MDAQLSPRARLRQQTFERGSILTAIHMARQAISLIEGLDAGHRGALTYADLAGLRAADRTLERCHQHVLRAEEIETRSWREIRP